MEWKSIAIPKRMFDNIKKIIVYTAHTSVSEYVRACVTLRLRSDTFEAERYKERLEEVKDQ